MNKIALFITLMFVWLFLSGQFDPFHIALGGISCAIVTAWSHNLFFQNKQQTMGNRLKEAARLIPYSLWLFVEIFKANLHVLYVVLHPKMNKLIDPKMMRFKSTLTRDIPLYMLANSITLTPGTITVRIKNGEFLVHALTKHTADGCPGDMEDKIKKIFGKHS